MKVRLPIGFKQGDTIVKEVELREIDGFSRQIIGDKQYRHAQAKLTTALLTYCIEDLGGKKPVEDDIRAMFVADRNAVMLHLQKLSVGNEVKADYICPWCQAGFSIVEDLLTIEFTEWDSYKDQVSVTLPKGYEDKDGHLHTQVVLALPTGLDEELTGHILRENYGQWCNVLLARQIRKFGDLDMKIFAGLGVKIIQALNAKKEIDLMINAITMDVPGYQIRKEVICKKCGRASDLVLDMSYFF